MANQSTLDMLIAVLEAYGAHDRVQQVATLSSGEGIPTAQLHAWGGLANSQRYDFARTEIVRLIAPHSIHAAANAIADAVAKRLPERSGATLCVAQLASRVRSDISQQAGNEVAFVGAVALERDFSSRGERAVVASNAAHAALEAHRPNTAEAWGGIADEVQGAALVQLEVNRAAMLAECEWKVRALVQEYVVPGRFGFGPFRGVREHAAWSDAYRGARSASPPRDRRKGPLYDDEAHRVAHAYLWENASLVGALQHELTRT